MALKDNSSVEGGVLAAMLHKILNDLGLNSPERINKLVDDYIYKENQIKKRNGGKAASPTISRKYVLDKVLSNNITWKTFLLAIFKILNVSTIHFTIKLKHASGRETVHEFTIGTTKEKHHKDEKDDG